MAEVKPTPKVKNTRAAGSARDVYVMRQTTLQTPSGPRDAGSGNGKGAYGPNRLHGQAQAKAIADSKKNSWPRTQRAMDEFLASGGVDSSKLLPFRPTNTIGPEIGRRRRTQAAGYDGKSKTVRILFSEGESATSLNGPIYEYYDVPYRIWRMVKRNISTGRTINRTLNSYRYARIR
ncbi:hypothetical protein [Streptomyces atratus]|uniref:hypothetical protein n=1 Tax=Streptomyces atratus TaxID=1893 RepID=UPI0036661F35